MLFGATTVSDSATLHTPASGFRTELTWLYLATPSLQDEVAVTVAIGAVTVYEVVLPSPGVFMHRGDRQGAINAPLTVTLDTAQTVYVNYEYEER